MTRRKFRRTTVKLVILHEEDDKISDMEIDALHEFVSNGAGVLAGMDDVEEVLDGKQAAAALSAAGSEPGFFQLDDKGNDT